MDELSQWVLGAMIVAMTASSGCGDDGGALDGGVGAPCESASDCDNAVFCDGDEACVDGVCEPGTPPCELGCDETTDACSMRCRDDEDADGHISIDCGGDDCDDLDAERYPGNTEICDDGHDEDCDPDTFGTDADGDGYSATECCNDDRCGDDCNDSLPGVNPGASDGCGGGDEDCDGSIDEEPDSTYFRDEDNDTYGVDTDTVAACSLPSGYAARGGDCVDDPVVVPRASSINPGETDDCNGIDDDCDGVVDDVDGDGTPGPCECDTPDEVRSCGVPTELAGVGICRFGSETCLASGMWSPCVDAVGPELEACNLRDDDCDGDTDETVQTTYYRDDDGDMYGLSADTTLACERPPGYSASSGDCDDTRSSIRPGAAELCDGADTDCDGVMGPEDADGDGYYGVDATCIGPEHTDCNDDDPLVSIMGDGSCECATGCGAVCVDLDCSGTITTSAACTDPATCEYVRPTCDADGDWQCPPLDCDDTRASTYAGRDFREWCNNLDDDCDGSIDEEVLAFQCDARISEYVEGTSNNKAIEIHGGFFDFDLEGCEILVYSNGSSTISSLAVLSGVLTANETLVVCSPQASDPELLARCDQFGSSGTINFNGDDAVVLRCSGRVHDVFGRIGEDPGESWTSGPLVTRDVTLRRRCDTQPRTDGSTAFEPFLGSEWDGFAVNTFSDLGEVHCP